MIDFQGYEVKGQCHAAIQILVNFIVRMQMNDLNQNLYKLAVPGRRSEYVFKVTGSKVKVDFAEISAWFDLRSIMSECRLFLSVQRCSSPMYERLQQ